MASPDGSKFLILSTSTTEFDFATEDAGYPVAFAALTDQPVWSTPFLTAKFG